MSSSSFSPSVFSFRKAEDTDIEFLLWLRLHSMEQHLLKAGIKLDEKQHLQRIRYHFGEAQIILSEEQPVGLLKVLVFPKQLEILQFQIAPDFRGKGLGKQVLKSVLQRALQEKRSVKLSVLKENPARTLYLKFGFELIEENSDSFILETSYASICDQSKNW